MFLRGRPITMYVPSGLGPYGGLRAELPPERLQLDWVYGYRGRDSRSNLHVLASGELVYFIACVVVLLHVPLRRQRHYLRHSDCVRCLAVHPDRLRVATGQAAGVDKDGKPLQPVVHIWDSATLLTLQQIGLGSFERGVGSLAFSTADLGAHLCVVDDSNEHMMSVWDCARGTKLAEVKSTNESVLSVEFNPQDSGSIITSGKSHVYFWTWSGAALTKKQGIFGKYKKPKFIQCFVFDAAGDVLTGDSEGNILTWTRAAGPAGKGGKGLGAGRDTGGGGGGGGGAAGGVTRLVAVADDFCKVHLFQYPCARPKAPSHVYGGHGSHVTNVRFTHDDGHLVSLGGKDTGVFQWRVLGGPPVPAGGAAEPR
uniref:Echinoderm microtubule associated protein like 3 n=1 Tax=Cairina moschata TaxID=8855 RepID=A0A8C3CA06_CAIMO